MTGVAAAGSFLLIVAFASGWPLSVPTRSASVAHRADYDVDACSSVRADNAVLDGPLATGVADWLARE